MSLRGALAGLQKTTSAPRVRSSAAMGNERVRRPRSLLGSVVNRYFMASPGQGNGARLRPDAASLRLRRDERDVRREVVDTSRCPAQPPAAPRFDVERVCRAARASWRTCGAPTVDAEFASPR